MLNYKDIELKIGIEIHQELSGSKLFCSCSTNLKEKDQLIAFMREIRASKGETGKLDVASLYEQGKNMKFIYYGYENEFCLLDCDEEPPGEINQQALKTALGVAKTLKLQIPHVIEVMRKIITDGSAVSGFQRSAQIGHGTEKSIIKTSNGDVRIKDLYLEEDAAKIIKKEKDKTFYSLSRLGIPLLEIGTQPDIKTPEQAKEVASYLGMFLRSFQLTKRGLGTIRQDVSLSIKSGARIELKGVQDLRNIPKIIEIEVNRQLSIIKEGKKIEPCVRKINPDLTSTYLRPLPGAARIYPETDVPTIEINEDLLYKIKTQELIIDKTSKLEENYNLSKELANEIVKEDKIKLFENFCNKFKNLTPGIIAHILIEKPKEIKSKFNVTTEKLNDEVFSLILENLNSGKISKNSVIDILLDYIKTEKLDFDRYKTINKEDLEKEIKDTIEKNKDLSFGALMGIIMNKFKGTVDGKLASELINKYKK